MATSFAKRSAITSQPWADVPQPLDDVIRRRMKAQGRRDTKPELMIRRKLHARGYRFRVDFKPEPDLRCRGDIVFTRRRLVIFIDGCFWHGCPVHATAPKNNAEWWAAKIAANQERDGRNTRALRERGWAVLRIWEHTVVDEAVTAVISALDARSTGGRTSDSGRASSTGGASSTPEACGLRPEA